MLPRRLTRAGLDAQIGGAQRRRENGHGGGKTVSGHPKAEAERLARDCIAVLAADDHASRALDIEVVETGAGRAALRMRVTAAMANGHGLCHGGYIFLLADSACAYAANSYDHRVVTQHASVSFIAAGRSGDVLTARAREVSRAGRSGLYDVTVTRQDGAVIAEFRGHSRQISGRLLAGEG